MNRRCLPLLVMFTLVSPVSLSRIAAKPAEVTNAPDITGNWNGTWEIAEIPGYTSNFSIAFVPTGNGILSNIDAPELGLFNQFLPASIELSSGDYILSIVVPGILEIAGQIDGNSILGRFTAVAGSPPFAVSGFWYAERDTQEDVFPTYGTHCRFQPRWCRGVAS